MSQVTIKELSKILNISISTVSKALNNSKEISQKTKRRVIEVADQYGYQPHPIAKRLKQGKSYTIAVVIPSIQDSFFNRVLHGIEEAASNTLYNFITCSTRNSHSKEVEIIKNLSNGVVDGFIIAPATETLVKQQFGHLEGINANNRPIVLIDKVIESIKTNVVKSNNKQAVFDATNRLIHKGRRNIALVSYNSDINTGKERIEGYIQSLSKNDLDSNRSSILRTNAKSSRKKLHEYLSVNKFDAIICTDEQSSYDVLRIVKKLKISIPEDMSIIGYMDENVAPNLYPELTTINQHRKTIGNKAFKLLIGNIHNIGMKEKTLKINSTLEIRESF